MNARARGSKIKTDARVRSTVAPDTTQPSKLPRRNAAQSPLIVYKLPASTTTTITSTARNIAVGADGTPPMFSRRSDPDAPATSRGVRRDIVSMAAPSRRENWQLGGIHAQTRGQIGIRQSL